MLNILKDDNAKKQINLIEEKLKNEFCSIDKIQEHNFEKVLNAFKKNKVSSEHFIESTGYGYDDDGRDVIDKIYADIFNTEDALVRANFVSGTHGITTALFSILRPGDELLYVSGMPYDTLHKPIGIIDCPASMKEYGIQFDYVDLIKTKVEGYDKEIEYFDFENIKKKIKPNTKVVAIQRSKGYSLRHSFLPKEIGEVVDFVKNINSNIIVFVDNCYGELVLDDEPTDYGVDIMAGSLIKNMGGGLCKSGAYIVGRKDLIEMCSYRLMPPGQGKEVGSNFNQNLNILQGLFFAPQVVSNALKGAVLLTKVVEELGFETYPSFNEKRGDIVCATKIGDEEKLNKFVNIIQSVAPVDSFVKAIANDMPGYENKVIMACGAFIQGSSIELSSDGPMIPPYIAYTQGGLSYYQMKMACREIIDTIA